MTVAPIVIDSLDDPRVDVYRNVRDADLRGRDHLFMAESETVLRRLLRTPQRLHSMLLSPPKFERLRAALDATNLPNSTSVFVAELNLIHEIAAFHVHRGVLAAGFRLPSQHMTMDAVLAPWRDQATGVTFLLAEGITNVDNMGALFRNAAAFGADAVVLDRACCDPLYRKAIRVSMGHTLSVPYAIGADWPNDLQRLKSEWDLVLIGAEVHVQAKPLWEIRHFIRERQRVGILFGSEGQGLSGTSIDLCDALFAIPMARDVPSLNVAVASAVVLYELGRNS